MGESHSDIFVSPTGTSRRIRGVAIYSGSPRLAELAVRIGFETVWIEMEHGPTEFAQAERICHAVEAGGGVATVRVPDGQRVHVLRALEIGVRIVVVPMVETADEAARIVEYGKFPPVGLRGYNTRSRGVGYGLLDPQPAFAAANERTYLFAQIETPEAVAQVEAICSVPGLAGILIGPGDLSSRMNCPGDLRKVEPIRTIVDCIRRARSAGKHAGILVAPGPLLDAAIEAGCDLCFCGGDVSDLIPAWRALLDSVGGPAGRTGAHEGEERS